MLHHHHHRHIKSASDAGDFASPRSSRAASFSSDKASATGSASLQMPSSVLPAPAYIAASVASQIVTDHHNAQLRDEHTGTAQDNDAAVLTNALFSDQALRLLNAFLDHLLFAFLSTARSPSLTAVRPAITDVLKPRLAREAMEAADEELQGLLAGEDDEFPARDAAASDNWDVEKVWKRTRLRIMVYTRLGELEDDDEERYVQQERGLSMDESDDDEAGLVSWASAIFLTSVIEYVAEQTLLISGTAAFTRLSAKMKKLARQAGDGEEEPLERIIVEEPDAEKIALNAALGRLWRTWRKRVRSPVSPTSPGRSLRYMSSYHSLHRRKISHDTADESVLSDGVPELPEHIPEHKPTETEIAANIPLPMGDNDVNEIEVPGLANTFEEPERSETETPVARLQRPASAMMLAPIPPMQAKSTKERPVSMPPPQVAPFVVPSHDSTQEDGTDDQHDDSSKYDTPGDRRYDDMDGHAHAEAPDTPFETPMERFSDDDSYIHDEEQEYMHHHKGKQRSGSEADQEQEPDADMVAFAASTGMGFGMSPRNSVNTTGLDKDEDNVVTPTQPGYDGESQVLDSQRMSIERTGPPGIVRTYSTRSSSARSRSRTPVSTPGTRQHAEQRSYVDDSRTEDHEAKPKDIGVARTSNRQIRATPSPPVEASPPGKGTEKRSVHARHPSHGGYVEVLPRPTAPTSMPAGDTPSADAQAANAESSVGRKEVPRKEAGGKEAATSAARWRDGTPPKQKGAVLPSLQEAESRAPRPRPAQERPERPERPERQVQRTSSSGGSTRQAPSRPPLETAASSVQRHSAEGAQGSPRSDKLSSSSSTNKSVSTSILHTGRDSETSLTGRPRGLSARSGRSGRMSEEDREREFDSLVKGHETVKYTLTPQAMREIDQPPVVKRVEQQQQQQQQQHQQSPQQSTPQSPHLQQPKPASSVTVYPRVAADKDSSFGSSHLPFRSASRSSKRPTASAGRPSPSKRVGVKPLAREPQIKTESMRDFADFIRSTGPAADEQRPVQPFVNLSSPEAKQTNGATSAMGGLGRKLSMKQSPSHSHSNPNLGGGGPSARPRVHMEPRSPAGQRSGNDDLIDFIRQGPPGANNGQHRIPRSVAPFRTTVDSDQFDRMLDENGHVESAYGSQVSTVSKQSNQTANSRTALLPSANVVQPAYSNTPQKLTGSMSASEPQITRTRRRVKDPYAIDLSDEEEEDEDALTALPTSSTKRKEESMMDFLNGMEPPSANEPPQPLMLSPATLAAAKARAQQKSSPSSTNGNTSTAHPNQHPPPTSSPRSSTSPPPRPVANTNKPRLQARTAGARDARTAAPGGRPATNDLADFLRSSGPPEPPASAAPPPGSTIRKDEGRRSGINAKFWRKKTYGDMP